jgi:glycopeptide antibiotics resistance protein
MGAFIFPIKIAIILFPVLAILILLPFLVVQYHRYGSVIFWRAVVIYTFIFYLLCAYFLVILPLPAREEVAKLTTQRFNLVPFMALQEWIKTTVFVPTQPGTWLASLKQPSFIQPFFNVILTLPFGVYLRYYFRQPLRKIILWGFVLSLFFEITQLSGLYGIYPRPYRLFDVDDLILNTTGALIGGILAPFFVKAFPTRNQMDNASYIKSRQVSLLRRLTAYLFDYIITGTVVEILLGLTGNAILAKNTFLSWVVSTSVVFILIPILTRGQTLGKKIVKIRIVKADGELATRWQLFFRQILLFGVGATSLIGANRMIEEVLSKMHQSQGNIVLLIVSLIAALFVVLNVLWEIIIRENRFFYDVWAKTTQISVIKEK